MSWREAQQFVSPQEFTKYSFSKPGIDLSRIELVNPGPDTNVLAAARTGIPSPAHAVTILLFIGICKTCDFVLNMLKTWFNRANIASEKNQLEVILVSAHKRVSDFQALVADVTNPFFAVPFGSEMHEKLLKDFDVESLDDPSKGEPRIAFLEWIGARYHPGPAVECETIRYPQGYIADMNLTPLVGKIDFSKMESRRLVEKPEISLPKEFQESYYHADDEAYMPISGVQAVRDYCSFYFTEIRDNLFDLRSDQAMQKKYLQAMHRVANRICATDVTEDGLDLYNAAIEDIRRSVGSVHLLELLGAGKAKEGWLSGRLHKEPHPRINCNFFPFFFKHALRQFAPDRIKTSALPGKPMFMIRIYYRTSTWTAVRDRFPSSIHELRQLVGKKVINVELDTARLFSDDLSRGALFYTKLQDIASHLDRAPVDHGMTKIRIIVMGNRKLIPGADVLRYVAPARNKEQLYDQTAKMVTAIGRAGLDPFVQETLKISAAVAKLSELEETQDHMLRLIPVQRLHMDAAKEVIRKRDDLTKKTNSMTPVETESSQGLRISTSFDRSSMSQSPPWDKTMSEKLARMQEWDRISYDEELLKQLVDWFSTEFFSWLSPTVPCQHGTACKDAMYLMHTAMRRQDKDAQGHLIEHDVLKPYLIECYICNSCLANHRILRPLQDIARIVNFPKGRCAEHGKAFHLAARALGFESRIVTGRFRPRETYADSDPRSRSLTGSESHTWNEIFLENRKEWIPVDVSANPSAQSESGWLGVPETHRYDHLDMFSASEFRIFFAVAVNKDSALIVTERYATEPADLEYAHSIQNGQEVIAQVQLASKNIAETDVNRDTESVSKLRTQIAYHRAVVERLSLDNRSYSSMTSINPSVGVGSIVPGPSGANILIVGSEIPNWRARRPESLFHTYNHIMRFDHIAFTVCRVEVYKEGELVSDIRFGYCIYGKREPISYASTHETYFGLTHEAENQPFFAVNIDPSDWILDMVSRFDDAGLLVDIRPKLASDIGAVRDGFSSPIIGFYGGRRSLESPGIDFIGLYQIKGTIPRDNEK